MDNLMAIPIFRLLILLTLWSSVGYLLAHLSGWNTLTKNYRIKEPFVGKKWYFVSGSFIKKKNYDSSVNCTKSLIFGVNQKGIYMSPILLFRIGFPPLFFPWAEVSYREENDRYFSKMGELTFQKNPEIRVIIKQKIVNKMIEASGNNWTKVIVNQLA
jgi:hypothetical protein